MNRPLFGICVCGAGLITLLALAPSSGVAEGPTPPPIVVDSQIPALKIDGATGLEPLSYAAPYVWNVFIALNWPAQSGQRGVPAADQPFGSGSTTVWETLRSKNELYPGNASPDIGPHGAVIDPNTHKATNPPDYGYGDPPDYVYSPADVGTKDGRIAACPGQANVPNPAWIPLDETTEIGVNQTFAGVLPAKDPKGFNSKPQLIRYAVKMNKAVYQKIVSGQYWYSGNGSPLDTARQNYVTALGKGQSQDPNPPFVNFAPGPQESDPNLTGIELKMSWRPLTSAEASSGRFFKTTVRYYEENAGFPCYREAEWGLVGMHVITFPLGAPWVIWSTFEQADNILNAGGKPMEDVNGRAIVGPLMPPTTPALSSNPNLPNPTVTKKGDYCTAPGARLFFRENGDKGTLPADGNICVNHRWHPIPAKIVAVNADAHQLIAKYLAQHGKGSSPLSYYKLINVQGIPVDAKSMNGGEFSTMSSYYMANSTIETDYSLGMFSGHLANDVPSYVTSSGKPYYNTQLLPFQSLKIGSLAVPMRMGGCGGCHGNGALRGQDFSFALGDNVKAPEPVDAFKTHLFRDYFAGQ